MALARWQAIKEAEGVHITDFVCYAVLRISAAIRLIVCYSFT